MSDPAPTEDVVFAPWSVRSFDVRRHDLVVRCLRGEVLVTREGDPEDHVIGTGGALHCHRRGRVVVAGLLQSLVRVTWSIRTGQFVHASCEPGP
jgi:hypothetical protein